jgi:hypothetical protein
VRVTTSRYQNHEGIMASGLTPVRITLGAPRMTLPYTFGTVMELAPSRKIFRLSDKAFDKAYPAQLDDHGLAFVTEQLTSIMVNHKSDGVVLLCYEDLRITGEYGCHRRLFADWWERHTGMPCPELPDHTEPKPRRGKAKPSTPPPPTLF